MKAQICPASDVRLVRQAVRNFPNAEILITYGPTEAAVDCTTWKAKEDQLEEAPTAALGWPDTFRAVEVSSCGDAVLLGCSGELHICGPGLANGYVAQHLETAKAFVSAQRAAGAQYRTGDAVRWRGQMCGLEFLGRLDAQAGAKACIACT